MLAFLGGCFWVGCNDSAHGASLGKDFYHFLSPSAVLYAERVVGPFGNSGGIKEETACPCMSRTPSTNNAKAWAGAEFLLISSFFL